MRSAASSITTAAAALTAAPLAWGQAAPDFYRGKTVDLQIGYSVGGGYDVYARMLAPHMAKHIPGSPSIVAKNMEGAGSLRLANWLYNVAPKDGTAFGTIGRGTGFDPLFGHRGAQFDGAKFTWIPIARDSSAVILPASYVSFSSFAAPNAMFRGKFVAPSRRNPAPVSKSAELSSG